jgi:hypothetical protein
MSDCQHKLVVRWKTEDGQPVDLWACADCRWRFEPLRDEPEETDWEAVAADQAMTIAMLRTEIAALAEQEAEHRWLVLEITTAYEQGVGKGQQRRAVTNPYTEGSPGRTAWAIGYAKGLKMKAEQEAEPVAWIYHEKQSSLKDGWLTRIRWTTSRAAGWVEVPLYSHPPRREWVGLTDEEIKDLAYDGRPVLDLARAIEAALKEKNHD